MSTRASLPAAWRRMAQIARFDLRQHVRSPLFAALVAVLLLGTLTLNPAAMIASGDSSIAGIRPFVNSSYAMAQIFALAGVLFYCFLACLIAGLTVLRDDETRIAEILSATPMTPTEYVFGKYFGVAAALGLALGFHVLFAMLFFETAPIGELAALRGPFRPANYVVPALLFAGPAMLLAAGLAVATAVRTRSAMAVYALPTFLVLGTLLFLVAWNPGGSSPALDHALVLLDPSGLRWLRRTVFGIDRGIDFYNHAPLFVDAALLANRLSTLAVPLVALWLAARGMRVGGRAAKRIAAAEPLPVTRPRKDSAPLGPILPNLGRDLEMTSARPSFAGTVVRFAGADLRHLLVQPGFLAFGGMVVLTVLEFAASANQAADSPIALSAGSMAVGAVEVLTLLGCLLLLFTGVETLSRDQRTGLEDFLPAYPFRTSAQVLGKGLVGAVVAVLVLGTAFIASLGVLLFHGAAVDLTPFGWVWGVLLPPTFLVWIAFVLAAWSLLRRRAAVYALGLIVLLISALAYLRGGMTWSGNWLLWGTLRWSDFGPFDLDGRALVWNRSTLLAAALFLTALAIALARRAEPDALARGRNRGRRRRARALGLGALALLPIGLGGRLAWEVRQGFQGELIRERAREYRRRNFATWRGVEPAAILAMNLKIDLEPSVRSLLMEGTYRVLNHTELAMPRIPFTLGPSFDDVRWTLNGAPAVAETRSHLQVLTPDRPLPPGGEIVVGFSYRTTLPRGLSRNGGEVSQFVLPSGIVLGSLTSGFLPQPGFDEGLGVDREDRFDPPEPAPDLGRARLDPVIGSPVPFDARLEISAPRDFTVLAVGRKLSEQHDKERTTVVWETEAPVRALNLVAGRFEVLRREGVAVFHHPAHTRNVEEIAAAVAAARRRYSEWFHPYPWGELKLSEIPNWVARAQGFPTLLTFSEGFGFLSASDTRHRRAFWITAHEAAHQWWGNLVTPGKAPGADLLIEGLANYSALLLVESELGIRSRIDFALWLESRYAERRRIDTERPLIEILDTARPADETAVYDRGAWVFWMLQQQLGSARMLDGLRAFANQYAVGGDRPLVQDLVQSLRQVASDESGFQTFVDQWLFDVVTPEFQLSAPGIESATNGWTVSAILENVGTGVVDVEVAIEGGERFDPNGDGEAVQATFLEVRQVVHLNPGEPQRLSWQSAFRPDRVVVDPEAKVLQINRRRAVMRF